MTSSTSSATSSVRYLKGVGPKRALALERLGITSVRDLLYFFPRRYEDRSQFRAISDVVINESVTLRGEILSVALKPIRRFSILQVTIGDRTGVLHGIWFNQPYLKNQFVVGQEVILFGKVELYQNRLQINSPEYEFVDADEEAVHTGRITPIYPLTEGLFQRSLRSTLREVLNTQLDKSISDFLPEIFRQKKNLMNLGQAVQEMHFPESFEQRDLARRRIVFDEFLIFEIALLKKMEQMKSKYRAYPLARGEHWSREFQKSLPFSLTPSQKTSFAEVAADLAQASPMNRLLQGDVGSGKTVVAALAFLIAAKNEKQAAFLVPTEILAEQHFRTLEKILMPFDVSVRLLTASTPTPVRERLLAELKQGKVSILVGTHALLQENVRFASLAVVVTDEQHKFGVYQRCQLLNADPRPHQLVMTATPIPRTLALTVYGDLEVSSMKELPAGRQPIKTYWIQKNKRVSVFERIREKVKQGEQTYILFPLIDETEKSDMLAAKREYETLRHKIFPDLKIGLVHGRLSKEERDRIMEAFRRGEIQVLAATSVIEVGVDHPNATMMVIENAERFGLAQLHQMRGRIGRGTKASECFLFSEPRTDEAKRRLEIMTKTQDGFVIAEEDLKLRGPGDFWGTRQSGAPLFRVADPMMDYALLMEAREVAVDLVKNRALVQNPEWQGLKIYLEELSLRY